MTFELCDLMSTTRTSDVLGMWAAAPAMSADTIAFAVPSSAADVSVWRIKLPANIDQAETHLTRGEKSLGSSQAALPTVTERIRTVVDARVPGVAFATPSVTLALAPPEAELWSWLSALQEGKPPVSFGLGEKILQAGQHVTQQFHTLVNTLVERLLQVLAHYTWVETYIGERLVGQTAVSWTGDVDTVWQAALSPSDVTLHQRAVALGLASRDTLLQTLVVAVQGALTLSAALTTPGGALMALPSAWRFIHHVFAEQHQ